MALKALLDTLDGLDGAIAGLYVERDGKFHLDVEDVDNHPTVLGLKRQNAKLLQEKRDALAKQKAAEDKLKELPEGFDVAEYQRLKDEDDARRADPDYDKKNDKKHEGELQRLRQQMEQAAARQKTELENRVKAVEAERDEALEAVRKAVVDDRLTQELVAAGVPAPLLRGARSIIAPSAKVEKNEKGEYEANIETDLGPEPLSSYVAKWAQSDEGRAYIPKPTGGDSKGSDGRKTESNPWHKDSWNLTEQGRILKADKKKAARLMGLAGVSRTQIENATGERSAA